MRLNNLQAPFNNEAIRRAVMMAVDQEDYMGAVYGTDDKSVWRPAAACSPAARRTSHEDGAALLKAPHDPDRVRDGAEGGQATTARRW